MRAVITVSNELESLAAFLLVKKCEGQGRVTFSFVRKELYSLATLAWPDDTYYLNWLEWLLEMRDRKLITDFNLERKKEGKSHGKKHE